MTDMNKIGKERELEALVITLRFQIRILEKKVSALEQENALLEEELRRLRGA